ncbi:hypothetical protein BaRGS_00027907, partial [Batillaria attramentaria]
MGFVEKRKYFAFYDVGLTSERAARIGQKSSGQREATTGPLLMVERTNHTGRHLDLISESLE